jgi:hypothetical protein
MKVIRILFKQAVGEIKTVGKRTKFQMAKLKFQTNLK